MAWNVSGEWMVACSCKMVCPCNFGPATPDQEWCSAATVMAVKEGSSDGVDLSGLSVVLGMQLPGDFSGGNATVRMYVDERASADQARELEAIFTGKKGGVWEALTGFLVTKWLPTKRARIDVRDGEIEISGAGTLKLEPIKTQGGKPTRLVNSPSAEAFGIETADLMRANGSKWSDPDLRVWESLGYGERAEVRWSA